MNQVTTVDVKDPDLAAKLAAADGPILFRGPNGECIRWAESLPNGELPLGLRPPISDKDYEELRKQTGGRPLADILKDLRQKYGE